ncbi:ribonucleotide reductase [Cyanophage PSS2]|uniref:ribonucleotide reductase n=1 Tax=Cyanophage PSS2 TaxID=658401 RepID=UPI0001B03FE1|nr:ribonucleotide reductase [Cyanophage PSS2]ACT65573.1 NTP reductase [Cyanophage PSS2]ACY75717.1 ribonucleotide reductase [Cyanophage PSS2]
MASGGYDSSIFNHLHVDKNKAKADQYDYKIIPTILLLDDEGNEVYRSEGRVSESKLHQLFTWASTGSPTPSFPIDAPSADIVFSRTYARRREENGQRESFQEAVHRTVDDIAQLGNFSKEEKEDVLAAALDQHTFPSGRWLWVGGTDWIHNQQNFSGAYNCTSTNVDSPEAFGLMMELAMMGSGTGAILEDDMVAKLPVVANKLNIKGILPIGTVRNGEEDTLLLEDEAQDTLHLIVGDSRQGWVDAYQTLIDLAFSGYTEDAIGVEVDLDNINLVIDLSNVRPAGSKLKGFGGTANPVKLESLFTKVSAVLNDAHGRQLTPIEACLLIDEAASCIVAGNIRRSAGMRQFSWNNQEAADAKANLYTQDSAGNWKVDPKREPLRMANHTRCAHQKPSLEDVKEAVIKQFHSGEGAIQYVPEALARSSKDLLSDPDDFQAFIESYEEGYGSEFICSLIDVDRPEMDKAEKDAEIKHRLSRYGLNPCGEILGSDFHCNLAEVHLNQIDPMDLDLQDRAFRAAALQACALLHHQFKDERYQGSRELDPIVGVSFTGLFDFFIEAFGERWLGWMMRGRPATECTDLADREAQYLSHWKKCVEYTVRLYCHREGLRMPNRTTTVQPAGTKSLLTGASSGWHPPKAQRFIRRITVGAHDPVALAAMDYGYSVIPAHSAVDENGKLLDDIYDPRATEWLIEVPTEVKWATKEGCDQYDLSQLSAKAQFDLYMQVQRHYTTHNTSATIEFRENEIDELSELIHSSMGNGYISAALLARFDANATFPRLPFEPIDEPTYEHLLAGVYDRKKEDVSFEFLLSRYDRADLELEAADGACTSAACLAKAEKLEREGVSSVESTDQHKKD